MTGPSAASLLALMSAPGVGAVRAVAQAAADRPAPPQALERARRLVDEHERSGVRVLGYFDPLFPARLRAIPAAPAVLFCRGDLRALEEQRMLAVVGTRDPTVRGEQACQDLTAAACRAGAAIVSGLALGCDTIAHETCLREGRPTVAVLAGGLDRIHPAANRALADDIVDARGLLISEGPFGTPTDAGTLTHRNRLQSGLAAACLIVQSARRGGTQHTGRYAAQQHRPVLCPELDTLDDSGASDGVRVLLEQPACDLWQLLPAWREHRALCRRLGDEPLARAVTTRTVADHLHARADAPDEPEQTALF